jgi:pyrroline-5-carboxylate reductase
MNNIKIAFVGAGKMVSAIVKSLLQSETFDPASMACCSAQDGTSEKLTEETGILRFDSIEEMLDTKPDVLMLGCKPQQLAQLPGSVGQSSEGSLVLSIMAGITLDRLRSVFPNARNVVRSMPNTPGQVGAGATGFLFASSAEKMDHQLIRQILSSLGFVQEVKEEGDIDRVTAISGSGPAYVFEFACALEEAGKDIGLEPALAMELAARTVIGAAKLMEESGLHPEELRNRVTSPNGTTQAALESFSADELREIVRKAAHAARDRSIELSNA